MLEQLSHVSRSIIGTLYTSTDKCDLPHNTTHPLVGMVGARTLEEYKVHKKALKEQYADYYEFIKSIKPQNPIKRTLSNKIDIITMVCHDIFANLSTKSKNEVYYDVWALSGTLYNDHLTWGEDNFAADSKLLLKIMDRKGFLGRNSKSCPVFSRHEKGTNSNVSSYYHFDDRPPLEYGEIGYINGLANDFNYAKWDASRFSDGLADGKDFNCIYNATQGGVKDVLLTLPLLTGLVVPPTKLLLDQWQRFFHRAGPDEKFLQICYSQGSIHVKNALELLPENLRKRMCILSVAPVSYIPFSKDVQVMHFIKEDDFVNKYVIDRKWSQIENAPDVTLVQSGEIGRDPHDAFSENYLAAIRPYVQNYLKKNTIFLEDPLVDKSNLQDDHLPSQYPACKRR